MPAAMLAQDVERFNCFIYNVNEGLLQSHVDDMAFDANNMGWLSYNNGVQKFDGLRFTNVPVQPGLPDDKSVKFFKCSNGQLLFNHSGGISRYEPASNRFIPVYQSSAAASQRVLFLGEDEGVIYFLESNGIITGLQASSCTVISRVPIGFPPQTVINLIRSNYASNVVQHKIAFYIDSVFVLWDFRMQKQLRRINAILPAYHFRFWLSAANELHYMGQVKNALPLLQLNFTTGENKSLATMAQDDSKVLRGQFFPWQQKTYFSYYNNIYLTDSLLTRNVKRLVNFKNQPVGGNAVIDNIREDNFGNLYLLTSNDGIRKIIKNNYPIKYYGTASTNENFITGICADKKANRILAGSYSNGLLVFDTLQQLVKHIRWLPGSLSPFTPSCILPQTDGSYLLFIWGKNEVFKLNRHLAFEKNIPIKGIKNPVNAINYYSHILFQQGNDALVHSNGRVYKVSGDGTAITACDVSMEAHIGSGFINNQVVLHNNSDLLFVDTTGDMQVVKKTPLPHTGGVRCFTTDGKDNLYVGTNKGVFVVTTAGTLRYQLNREHGLPDECIYSMLPDGEGNIWCSTNKGIVKIRNRQVKLQLNRDDGLQENEFNSNVVARAADGELFFGGVNGISSFFPGALQRAEEKINVLVNTIRINGEIAYPDTAVWNIQHMNLAHDQNNLSFLFTAMGGNNPAQYIHQYKMQGIDKQWILHNGTEPARYLLQPGKYLFSMYAGRSFEPNARAIKQITIVIHPPFWKTWWFYTAVVLCIIALLAWLINYYNRRTFQKKLAELEGEQKLRLERERISRDLHDNIGAYANAVLYSTELLHKEEGQQQRKKLMNDLRFASKDIITSLRETIWALKKDEYTAQDCLLRIRNFIQPFGRYYEHIQFSITGEAPADSVLHYAHALNLVRIVQEAVSNAIKHANARVISVSSTFENNKWTIVISDNGQGFDYAGTFQLEQGNGLGNMNQRAAASGFQLLIHAVPGEGTGITVIV